MKRLYFDEMLLLSNYEKTGRRLKLHPHATVIKGENDTGKSSVSFARHIHQRSRSISMPLKSRSMNY